MVDPGVPRLPYGPRPTVVARDCSDVRRVRAEVMEAATLSAALVAFSAPRASETTALLASSSRLLATAAAAMAVPTAPAVEWRARVRSAAVGNAVIVC